MGQAQGRFVMLVMGDDDADLEERTYGLAQAARYDVERNTELKPLMAIGTMVADGCIVDGTVEHCVLFRGVKVAKGAKLKNCVIMQDSQIEEGVHLENCILDKQAVIKRDGKLIGPSSYPIVISKDMTI